MVPQEVKIYAGRNVPRLNYTAGLIIGDILGLSWEIVTDKRKLGKFPVINYSNEVIAGSFTLTPDSLLFESGISKKEINVTIWNELPVFFQSGTGSDFPFDIFAASFYLVTRYEEYLDFMPDEHGRFCASSSLAWKHGFLDKPVVDLWAREFAKSLLSRIPTLAFKRSEFSAILTIDTDQPFAFKGKNLLRNVGGLIRDLSLKSGRATERYKVMAHDMKDPYEVFDYMIRMAEINGTETKFFFPTGSRSEYDHNPSWKNDIYRDLIRRITTSYEGCLHPSFQAAKNHKLIKEEHRRLEVITGRKITSGRFHYIRLFTPESYRNLSRTGIKTDYSMGFHDEPGFRAGIARPYHFYDVVSDEPADLYIVPFQVMDVTLYQYKKLDAARSEKIIFKLIDITKKAGGLFVSLWHNTSLLETTEWQEWRSLFEKMLQYQRP